MRIVVFSDSHGDFDVLHGIVRAQPSAQAFLHLGDGHREFEDLRALFLDKIMLSVRGNCDWGCTAKDEDIYTFGGKRIFFTHGYQYEVRRGPERIIRRACELKCDIALYGHTHLPFNMYTDGIYLLNPGSVAQPRGAPPSYGVIDITTTGITASILPIGPSVGQASPGRD